MNQPSVGLATALYSYTDAVSTFSNYSRLLLLLLLSAELVIEEDFVCESLINLDGCSHAFGLAGSFLALSVAIDSFSNLVLLNF